MTATASSHDAAARVERRWGALSLGILVILVFLATFAGVHQANLPQARVESVDPTTLHVAGDAARLTAVLETM